MTDTKLVSLLGAIACATGMLSQYNDLASIVIIGTLTLKTAFVIVAGVTGALAAYFTKGKGDVGKQ